MKNKNSKIIVLSLVILFILGFLVFININKNKYFNINPKNNSITNSYEQTGAVCIQLIDEKNKCYQPNELTCEQVCTKGMWSEHEGKITNPNFTKWEYLTEKTQECKEEKFTNTKTITSPDGGVHSPGQIVISEINHNAGWGFKDSPTPTSTCCCDY